MSLSGSRWKSLFSCDDSVWLRPQNGLIWKWQHGCQAPVPHWVPCWLYLLGNCFIACGGDKSLHLVPEVSLVIATIHTALLKAVPAQCRSDYGSLLEFTIFCSLCKQGPILESYFLQLVSLPPKVTRNFPNSIVSPEDRAFKTWGHLGSICNCFLGM